MTILRFNTEKERNQKNLEISQHIRDNSNDTITIWYAPENMDKQDPVKVKDYQDKEVDNQNYIGGYWLPVIAGFEDCFTDDEKKRFENI